MNVEKQSTYFFPGCRNWIHVPLGKRKIVSQYFFSYANMNFWPGNIARLALTYR